MGMDGSLGRRLELIHKGERQKAVPHTSKKFLINFKKSIDNLFEV